MQILLAALPFLVPGAGAQAQATFPLGTMPPEYWAARPGEQAFKLQQCRRMSPPDQAAAGCATVFQSLELRTAPSRDDVFTPSTPARRG